MADYDLLVIGAGPGGYVAAIRAAQLGLKVACVERERALGGTCLRVGCIPSKALLESTHQFVHAAVGLAEHGVMADGAECDLSVVMKRKKKIVGMLTKGIEGLFQKHGVTRLTGEARFLSPGEVAIASEPDQTVTADAVIIATGSTPASLPGIEFDGDRIGSSTEALSYDRTPDSLVVIGAGYIGVELGSVWSRLGSQVTVLEYLDHILPLTDREIGRQAQKLLAGPQLEFKLGFAVESVRVEDDQCVVTGPETIACDRVLVAVGRKPSTAGLGLEAIGLELDEKGRIPVDGMFATAVEGVYAIGDVIPGPMLAHKAEEDGAACAEGIVTGYCHVDYGLIPSVVYTNPEIAAVGQTEEQLKEAGIAYAKGAFPFRANGRARTLGQTDGLVKVLADATTDRLLGVHILGPQAGDLIAVAATAMTFGASSEDLAAVCAAHPTLAEALKEAALAVSGRAVHI